MKKDINTYNTIKELLSKNNISSEDLAWYNSVKEVRYELVHKRNSKMNDTQVVKEATDIYKNKKSNTPQTLSVYYDKASEKYPKVIKSTELPASASASSASKHA